MDLESASAASTQELEDLVIGVLGKPANLIAEFKIDKAYGALSKIAKSRARYFERQIESVVFDSPEIASSAIRQMGYLIKPPNSL